MQVAHCCLLHKNHAYELMSIYCNAVADCVTMCRAEFEGYSDDETVRVVMSGNQEPKSVDITDSAYEQGSDVSRTIQLECVPQPGAAHRNILTCLRCCRNLQH